MAMDPYETTNLLLSRIMAIDPLNSSKIMGYILLHDLGDRELARLASGHETLLLSVIAKAKAQLGLSSNTFPTATPAHYSPTRPNSGTPCAVDFARSPSGSPHSWPAASGFPANASPKSSPLAGSSAFPKSDGNGGGDSSCNGADALEDYPFNEYLSFLDDPSSKNEEFAEDMTGDGSLHRRRFSESDACLPDAETGGFGVGYRPSSLNSGVMVGSPREMESLYLQQREGMMRLKAAHQQQQQQRMVYNKYMNFLLQNDPQRVGAAEEIHKFGRFFPERKDFLSMSMAERANSASRQIYLTFPADSAFRDEDVSNYFSTFGPVEDVRIPYQQKRMFGFVTFLHAETVKLILARGNPHFICESRVLVKPYKEKGKAANERQHHLHQQLMERGNFSPSSSPSGLDGREPYPTGPRLPYNSQEILMRFKLEEQVELQQAIELQGRRLINLQLPDLRGDYVQHHQRSLSVGAPVSMPNYYPLNHNVSKSLEALEEAVENSAADDAAKQNSPTDVKTACYMVGDKEANRNPDGIHIANRNPDGINMNNCNGNSFDHNLPEDPHTNASGKQDLDFPHVMAEMKGSSSLENESCVSSISR